MITEPGVYPGRSRAEYVEIPAANFSTIKHFKRSAAHARDRMLNPKPSTPDQELGTLMHCAVFEPQRYESDYVRMPDFATGLCDDKGKLYKSPRATKKYEALVDEFKADNPGRLIVTEEQHATKEGILEWIAASVKATELLTAPGFETEVIVVWIDPETGVLCKGLIDHLAPGCILDLKDIDDASPGEFARLVLKNAWHVQAAYYVWGLGCAGQPIGEDGKFVHLAAEVSRPYCIATYELDNDSLQQGIKEFRKYLDQYAACLASGRWPGYEDKIVPLSIPKYGLKND